MAVYHFPLPLIVPEPDLHSVELSPYRVSRRLWHTSTFDFATLATKHKIHLSPALLEALLSRCNVEVAVEADSLDKAVDRLNILLLSLYLEGVPPTLAPVATTHSINEYSGINSRDSDLLRSRLPEGLQAGITSTSATVEIWPVHLSLSCQRLDKSIALSKASFGAAAFQANRWARLEGQYSALRPIRDSALSAPLLPSRDQSMLHIWCALESLFPRVSSEVSFRIGLYLTQLTSTKDKMSRLSEIRKLYDLRSRVAHGGSRNITQQDWEQAWNLLLAATRSILERGHMPTEEDLLKELLTWNEHATNENL